MKKLQQEEEKKSHKKIAKFIKYSIGLLVFAFILQVWMVNRLSTYGYKIKQLQEAQANLEMENQILENQIAQESSLLKVESKAILLGFKNIKKLEYYKSDSLASKF